MLDNLNVTIINALKCKFMHNSFACLITVRTSSTRLPQKALLPIKGKSTIEHLIDRTKLVQNTNKIILCTSDQSEDDILIKIAQKNKIDFFRGSLNDKLSRWLGAVEKFKIDYFVTVDGDDIFADPYLIDLAIEQMQKDPCDFLKIPDDLVCGGAEYCISSKALKKVCEIKDTKETEMMWVYFTQTGLFNVRDLNVADPIYHNKKIRMTLDYKEDLEFLKRVFDEFHTNNNNIPLKRILQLIQKKPEIAKINFYRQEEFLRNQKNKTKLILKTHENNSKVQTSNSWRFRGNELKYVKEVLDSGFGSSTSGNMNTRLEKAFSQRFGVKYAVTSNSGTSTLHQALAAVGVGHGDEVIIPPLTVIMCGYAVLYTGARPVFADVDPDTFLIDPKDIERKITKKTKAIMPVHLYGQVCNMEKIMAIAKKHKLYVIEDCAECYLGTDNKGRIGGTIGHIGSFSFENSKHLSTGDGGILITNEEVLAERMRKFGGMGFKNIKALSGQVRKNRDIFQDPKYLRHDSFGWNYRLPEVAAAVGLAQLEQIDFLVNKRKQIATKYLETLEGCDYLIPQKVPNGYANSYWTFAARYEGQEKIGVSWYEFRKKFMEYGGDGIYAAWALVYNEPIMQMIHKEGKFFNDLPPQATNLKGFLNGINCPIAEILQPKIMQFTSNQGIEKDIDIQMNALKRTINFFK